MKNTVNIVLTALAAAFAGLALVGLAKKPSSIYADKPEEQNPFEGKRVRFVEDENNPVNADGVRGHLEIVTSPSSPRKKSFYERFVKRGLDIVLSGFGLIILSPVYLLVGLAVYIDDPGPVLFTQKRVGRDKQFFKLHKFRSMRMDTPHDVPTHELKDPDKYITAVGKVIRKTSLDELPQVFDIWLGNMSVIGPRPALWNQDKLTALRDSSSAGEDGEAGSIDANSVTPGLTGLAQIKGRDELELEDKAALDREYVKNIAFLTDLKCFFGTIASVVRSDGVVEGGTGEIHKHS